jgi:hypothetical protein
MLTQKTSIYALAVAAGLTLCLAPQPSFAQTAADWAKLDKEFPLKPVVVVPAPAPPVVVLPAPAPPPPTVNINTGGQSGFSTPPTTTTTGATVPELSWWEKLKLRVKLMAIMFANAVSSSKEEVKTEQSKVEQPKTISEPAPVIKTAAVPEKTVDLKTVEMKHQVVETLMPKATEKLVSIEAPKPAELNLNTVEHVKAKGNELVDTQTPKPTTKLVPTEVQKAELNLNTVESLKAKSNEPVNTLTLKSTAKVLSIETPKAKTSTPLRATVTTVSHLEVSHPTVNIVRPVVNVPRPTINIPHPTINIPVMIRR